MISDVGGKDESGDLQLRFSQSSHSQTSQSLNQRESPARSASQTDLTSTEAMAAAMKRNYN